MKGYNWPFIPIIFIFLVSCTQNKDRAESEESGLATTMYFTSIYDTLSKIDLPLTWTPDVWSDLYMKHIEKNGIRHGDLTTDRPYGMLVDDENYKGVIFVSPDATGSPVLITFDRNGKQIDGKMLLGDWGNNDPSFGTSEIVTIDKNFTIHMIDSVSSWDLDETGDRIEATKKTTVQSEWYQILNTGVIQKVEDRKRY